MKQYIHILLISITSLNFVSCAMSRAKSEVMLEKRAAYNDKALGLDKYSMSVVPIQIPAKRRKVYVYPHQLPNGDYFLGGYIFAEIEKESINLEGGAQL